MCGPSYVGHQGAVGTAGIKVYYDQVYLVIEVVEEVFNQITEYCLDTHSDRIKYLLANEREIQYLSKIMGFDLSVHSSDYFKVKLID